MEGIVAFLSAMFGKFVGFFLKHSEYERKRRDDLADRDFARRSAIHDRRIHESRDFLEKWTSFIYFSMETIRIMGEEKSLKRIVRRFRSFDEEFKSIPSMRHEAKIREASIDILNDKELLDLQTELFFKLGIPMKNLMVLKDNIHVVEESLKFGIENLDSKAISDITKDMNFDESREAFQEANMIITMMKIRLDELAQ